jgi:tetratricopeptide (TPR) repeat protein
MQNRYTILIHKIICLVALNLAIIVALSATEPSAMWEQYNKAAKLYLEKAESNEILNLLESVQQYTRDPVLFSRAAFLTSMIYEQEGQILKAHMALQKINLFQLPVPESIKDETFLREGKLFLKQSNKKMAQGVFQKVVRESTNPFFRKEGMLALAWIFAEEKNWQDCDSLISLLDDMGLNIGDDERFVALKAKQALAKEQPQETIRILTNTKSYAGLSILADAYEMVGNPILAVSILKKQHDLYSNLTFAQESQLKSADIFMRAGDWLAAKSEYNRILQNNKIINDLEFIHFRLGWICLNLNEFENALTHFQIETSSEYTDYFKYMKAECFRRMGMNQPQFLEKAIMQFHTISAININSPLAPLAKLQAALCELEKGDTTSALVSLRQFVSLYPKDNLIPEVYFLLSINDNSAKSQSYLDRIIQHKKKTEIYDVAYFAQQYQDYLKQDYQKVLIRNTSIPLKGDSSEMSYWQRANHFILGESAYSLKHYDRAMQEYQLASSDHNDDLAEKARLGKTWCVLHLAGADSAAKIFKPMRSQVSSKNQPYADYSYASTQFLLQNYEEALRAYPSQLDTDENPEFVKMAATTLFRSAQCYYRLQYYYQAIDTWKELTDKFPNTDLAVHALYNIADTYFRANHFAEADSVYNLISKNYPESPFSSESSLKMAQSTYNKGDYEMAISRFENFIDQYPNHPKGKEALEGIQLCYYQIGQSEQATEVLQKVISKTTDNDLAADAFYRLALNSMQANNYQDAIEAFKEILTRYPGSSYGADAQFALAKCYLAQEDFQSANSEFQRFIQYFPQNSQVAEAYFLLGAGYYKSESYLSALDFFQKIITDYKTTEFYPLAIKNAGWCFQQIKDTDKAIQNFLFYLENYPDTEDVEQIELNLAQLYVETDKNEQGLKLFKKLQQAENPDIVSEASYHLAMFYLAENKIKEAESIFQSIISMGEKNNYFRLSSLAQLAAIYENSGMLQKAVSVYQNLAESSSEERWIAAAQERMKTLNNQLSTNNSAEINE